MVAWGSTKHCIRFYSKATFRAFPMHPLIIVLVLNSVSRELIFLIIKSEVLLYKTLELEPMWTGDFEKPWESRGAASLILLSSPLRRLVPSVCHSSSSHYSLPSLLLPRKDKDRMLSIMSSKAILCPPRILKFDLHSQALSKCFQESSYEKIIWVEWENLTLLHLRWAG